MKKGRVMVRRAPNQQSFGNCDSWTFIVGKKSKKRSRKIRIGGRCYTATAQIFTSYPQIVFNAAEQLVGELWKACGAIYRFPHDGLSQVPYTCFDPSTARILTTALKKPVDLDPRSHQS